MTVSDTFQRLPIALPQDRASLRKGSTCQEHTMPPGSAQQRDRPRGLASPDFVAKDGELAAAKPKTIAEALDELEGKVGKDGPPQV